MTIKKEAYKERLWHGEQTLYWTDHISNLAVKTTPMVSPWLNLNQKTYYPDWKVLWYFSNSTWK